MVNRSIDGLVMNQSDKAQQYNEIKTLIDRTLPLVEHGKGYRLGSEFWNQPFRIGNDETGLFTTLKKSEQGILPPIEHIAKPLTILKESDFRLSQPPVSHYPWHESKYLNQRLKQLDPLITELVPHRPQFSRLELVGKNPFKPDEPESEQSDKNDSKSDYIVIDDTWINKNIVNQENKENTNNPYFLSEEQEQEALADHPDVVQAPIFGPCIVFGGQTADWTGNDIENAGLIALESRLNFETKAGKRVLATFEILNIGTTSIYYDWRKLPDLNPFEMNNQKVQRFYFDTRSNVIMPGDSLKMHIVFKSNIGGIFTERWEFVTHPRLLSAASLVLTLRGVAVQEDKFKKNRILLEENYRKDLFILSRFREI
ncbi:MYCBP-associated -like isoform X4 [Brachionus plicatilis]|uniref:MYCBP-associated-like isoform X4 n=1 Tax=Brachionus plicatilis TaxID=10195 RepID=A0A3M7T3E8_BRAPC|nr:MYCBP-associated -like isoform X4 [Brachionus plicatilis]